MAVTLDTIARRTFAHCQAAPDKVGALAALITVLGACVLAYNRKHSPGGWLTTPDKAADYAQLLLMWKGQGGVIAKEDEICVKAAFRAVGIKDFRKLSALLTKC